MPQTTTKMQPVAAVDQFHRWAIEEAHGPVSVGVCRICSTTKQFKNWLADTDFISNEEHRAAR